MPVTKTTAGETRRTLWSGGSTTEYFIYPPGKEYADRDFEIRISSATVDKEPSTFTSLPGFHRLLMPLNAPMRLVFEEDREVLLAPMESTDFDGGVQTTSYGICTDFGIMYTDQWMGQLVSLSSGTYPLNPGFSFVYAVNDGGTLSWKAKGESGSVTFVKGDFFLFADMHEGEMKLRLPDKEKVVAGRLTQVL